MHLETLVFLRMQKSLVFLRMQKSLFCEASERGNKLDFSDFSCSERMKKYDVPPDPSLAGLCPPDRS